MKLRPVAIFLICVLATVAGCSDDQAARDPGTSLISTHDNSDHTLRIVFRWTEDDVASRQELETRDKVGQAIVEKGLGSILRSGTGMGWMDIIVEVENKNSARVEIEAMIKKVFPDAKFRIE